MELANRVQALSEEKAKLNAAMSKLKDEIAEIEASQAKRRARAYSATSREAVELLHDDNDVQEGFATAQSVDFNFGDDLVFVDGKSNFAASSLVILKNSFHLAMLLASLRDREFVLPRFMMFDNIEDKGMRPQRSANFQRVLCQRSNNAKTRHQIIFTTSMPAPELINSSYVVGPAYTPQNRTLAIH